MQIQPPVRVCQAYTQQLVAPPEQVLPLLCPVREYEWGRGWEEALNYFLKTGQKLPAD